MSSSSLVDVAILQRAYGRTMPKDIRSVHVLALSFQDLKVRWKAFLESTASSLDIKEEVLRRKGRDLAESLSSQIKAIKQELLQHLSTLLHAKQTETNPTEDFHPSHDNLRSQNNASRSSTTPKRLSSRNKILALGKAPNYSDTIKLLAHHSLPNHLSVENCLQAAYLEALWLARRVWVWSIWIAIVLADMELLSGSLALSTELHFALPIPSPPASGAALKDGRSNNARAHVMCSTLYSGYGALTYEVFCEYVRRCSEGVDAGDPAAASTMKSDVLAELADFLDCTNERAAVGADQTTALAWDGFFVHAAVLLYAVLARDETTAARAIQRWQEGLGLLPQHSKESDAQANQETSSALENEHFLSETTDSKSMEGALEMDIALVGSTREGEEAVSAFRGGPETTYVFARRVALAARLAAAEDYVALNRLLSRTTLGCCVSPTTGANCGPPNINSKEDVVKDTPLSFPIPVCAWFCLQLLCRMLAEHLIRRQYIANDIGKCFRPVISTDIPSSSGDNRLNFTFLTDCVPPSLDLHSEKSLHTEGLKESQTNRQSNDSRVVDLLLNRMHICSLIQLTSLRSKEGPWPLPKPLVSSAFNFAC